MTDLFSQPTFDDWYVVYPRKIGKDQARTTFGKAKLPHDIMRRTEIFADIWREKLSGCGTEERRRRKTFCPYPSSWLSDGGLWDDEDIEERLGRPKPEDIPKPFKIYSDSPEGQAWMNYEIEHVNKFAKSHWIATAFMLRPSPLPPIKE